MLGKGSELSRQRSKAATDIENAPITAPRQHREQTVVLAPLIAVLRQLGPEGVTRACIQLIEGRGVSALMPQLVQPGVGAGGSDPEGDIANRHEEVHRGT